MKRLILVRHAKTERRAESGEDFDRRLTEDGRSDAGSLGHALALAGLIPEVALVSAAARARETFEGLAPELPDTHVDIRPDLYEADAETLRAAAEGSSADTVMVIAHNPGVHALALSLVQASVAAGVDDRASLEQGFPTATAAVFEFVDGRTACLGVFRPGERPR